MLTRQLTHKRARVVACAWAVRGHDIALRRVCLALPCLALPCCAVQCCRLQCSTHRRDIKIRVPVSASPTALCFVRAPLAASCCPTAMLFPSVLISPKVSRPHASRVNPGCYRIAVGYPNSAHAPMPWPFCLAPIVGRTETWKSRLAYLAPVSLDKWGRELLVDFFPTACCNVPCHLPPPPPLIRSLRPQ